MNKFYGEMHISINENFLSICEGKYLQIGLTSSSSYLTMLIRMSHGDDDDDSCRNVVNTISINLSCLSFSIYVESTY
jgi:hypothetical protein